MITAALLIISNIFMTFAWYWQLRFPHWSIITAILVGWSIAFLEYCFAVPANRIGFADGFSGGQLKILQEVITLFHLRGLRNGRAEGADRLALSRRLRVPRWRSGVHVCGEGLSITRGEAVRRVNRVTSVLSLGA